MTWTDMNLHEGHGLLVRTGPNEVSISGPTVVKLIYRAGSRFNKAKWYPKALSLSLVFLLGQTADTVILSGILYGKVVGNSIYFLREIHMFMHPRNDL